MNKPLDLMSVRDVAAELGLKHSTIAHWITVGKNGRKLPTHRMGENYMLPVVSLETVRRFEAMKVRCNRKNEGAITFTLNEESANKLRRLKELVATRIGCLKLKSTDMMRLCLDRAIRWEEQDAFRRANK